MYKLNYQYVPIKPGKYPDGTYPEVLLENTSPIQSHWRKLVNNLAGMWCYSDYRQTSTLEINQQATVETNGLYVGILNNPVYLKETLGLFNNYKLPATTEDVSIERVQLLAPYSLNMINGLPTPWTVNGEDHEEAVSIKYTGLNLTEYFTHHPNLLPVSTSPSLNTCLDYIDNAGRVRKGYLYKPFEDSPYYYDRYSVKIINPYTFTPPLVNPSTKRLVDKETTYTIKDGKVLNINMNRNNADFHSCIMRFDKWHRFEIDTLIPYIKVNREDRSLFRTGLIDMETYSLSNLYHWSIWDEEVWSLLENSVKPKDGNSNDFIQGLPLEVNHANVVKITPVLSRQSVVIPSTRGNPPRYSIDNYKVNTTNYGIPNNTLCYEYINDLPNSLLDNATVYNNITSQDSLTIIKHPFAGIVNEMSSNSKQSHSFWLPEGHQNDLNTLNNRYTTRPVVVNKENFNPNYDESIRRNCYCFEMETNQDYTNVIGLPQNYIDNRTLHWSNHREKPLLETIKLIVESNNDWRYGAKEIRFDTTVQLMGNSIEFYKGDMIYNETVLSNHFNALLPYPTRGNFHEHERIGNKYWQLRHRQYHQQYHDVNNTRNYAFQHEAKIPLFIIPLSKPNGNASVSSSIENLVVTKNSRVLVGFSLDPLNRNEGTLFIANEGFRFDEVEQEGYYGKILAFKLDGQEDKVTSLTKYGRLEQVITPTTPSFTNLVGRQIDRLKRYCIPLRSRTPDNRIIRYDSSLYRFDLFTIEVEDLFTTMVDKIEYITDMNNRHRPIMIEKRFGKVAVIKDAFTIYNHGLKVTVELVNPSECVGVELPIDLDELSVDPRFKFTNRDLSLNVPSGLQLGSSILTTIEDRSTQEYATEERLSFVVNSQGIPDNVKPFIRNKKVISNRYLNNDVGTIQKGNLLYDLGHKAPYQEIKELRY